LDEPTSALQSSEIEVLFDVVRGLRGEGISVIYISHHLEEVFEICDAATVMRDGAVVGSRPIGEWTTEAFENPLSAGSSPRDRGGRAPRWGRAR
jgi:ribose transport system ATP-binding protein